jgi:hypothetical protein
MAGIRHESTGIRQPGGSIAQPAVRGRPGSDEGSQAWPKRERQNMSGDSEVEAGLALAGLGKSLGVSAAAETAIKPISGGEAAAPGRRRVSKKAKTEEEEAQPNQATPAPMSKKSCAECRRMKAKCDRVFPCSNCEPKSLPGCFICSCVRPKKGLRVGVSGPRPQLYAGQTTRIGRYRAATRAYIRA